MGPQLEQQLFLGTRHTLLLIASLGKAHAAASVSSEDGGRAQGADGIRGDPQTDRRRGTSCDELHALCVDLEVLHVGGGKLLQVPNTTTSHVATLCQEQHSPTVQGARKPCTKQKQRSCAIIAQPSKQGTHHVQLLAPFFRFKSSFSPSEVSLKLKVNTPEEPPEMTSG